MNSTPAAGCGIPRIDALYSTPTAPPLRAGEEREAIGAVQDLLSGHSYRGLPGIASPSYGIFGPATTAALGDFRQNHGLAGQEGLDHETFVKLVHEPASDPRASQVYITLALRLPFTRWHKLACLTAQMEGMGRFAAMNLNTDRAGLSFGILQWAQRPGALAELLAAFHSADQQAFNTIFAAGDATLAAGLLNHLRKPNGGLDASGCTTDPDFDLTNEPWISRFRQAALAITFQRVQIETAAASFQRSYDSIARVAPIVTTERGVAFLLDVANQFGCAGARQICRAVLRDGMDESALLEAVAAETVGRMPENFKSGVRSRRDLFLRTPLLSGEPFQAVLA